MSEEIPELRRDIKDLSIKIATLTQKIEDIDIPKQPCRDFRDHINNYHKNTLGDQVKDRAINTIITAIMLALLGYVWLGVVNDVTAIQLSTESAEAEK
jgi:hypothetical protein